MPPLITREEAIRLGEITQSLGIEEDEIEALYDRDVGNADRLLDALIDYLRARGIREIVGDALAAQGVKLVFMDNVPMGMKHGEDYVSVASADNFGNGVASAHLMAEGLDGRGSVGVVFHNADFFVTRQRYEAFRQTLLESYPAIEIVEEVGIHGPDFAADAQTAAATMLAHHRDLSGIWAVWDIPAEGVIAAARAAGRGDLVITTVDLGLNVALELARGGLVFGVGAQRPFDLGVHEAELAAGEDGDQHDTRDGRHGERMPRSTSTYQVVDERGREIASGVFAASLPVSIGPAQVGYLVDTVSVAFVSSNSCGMPAPTQ